jgi:hypothetical protein
MPAITLSDEELARLGGSLLEVKVCDSNGNLLGYVISPETRKMMYEWASAEFDNDELLKQARRETGGVSFEVMMENLLAYEAECLKRRGQA